MKENINTFENLIIKKLYDRRGRKKAKRKKRDTVTVPSAAAGTCLLSSGESAPTL
jgi:hypothetical protein